MAGRAGLEGGWIARAGVLAAATLAFAAAAVAAGAAPVRVTLAIFAGASLLAIGAAVRRAGRDALPPPLAAPLRLRADDPLLREATRRARGTLGSFRRLRAEDAGACAVKIPFATDAGAVEHVWAEVVALRLEDVVARLACRPATHRGPLPPTVRVPLGAIVDWQVVLPGGAVRGAYTTIAMIAACERDGTPAPEALREVRFLDAVEPACAAADAAAS